METTESPSPPPPRSGGRALLGLWPLAALGVFVFFTFRPLWSFPGYLFSTDLAQDGVYGAWFYDLVGRTWLAGGVPDHLVGFDYPCPNSRLTFPNHWDGILGAPLVWWVGWPARWNLQLAEVALANTLGVAALAAAAGCRGWGIVVAGALGLTSPPLWHELHQGRLNGAWSGVAFGATAAFLQVARVAAEGGTWRRIGAWGALAGGVGALALAIYPLYLVMLLPAGVVLAWPHLRRAPGRVLMGLGAAAALSLGLAADTLLDMWALREAFGRSFRIDISCDDVGLPCLRDDGHATVRTLLRLHPDEGLPLLPYSSAAVGVWLMVPLALLAAGRRLSLTLLLGWMLVLAVLAMGPCPSLYPREVERGAASLVKLPEWRHAIWCRIWPIHRMERLAGVAIGLAGVLSAIGIEAAATHLPRRWGRAVVLLGLLCAAHATWLLRAEVKAARWIEAEPGPVATHLPTLPPGPVAELPFDETVQFISVLHDPRHDRLNPLFLHAPHLPEQPFLRWLTQLGLGEAPDVSPTPADVAASGLQAVYLDPARCVRSRMARDLARCEADLRRPLTALLGEGAPLGGRARVWTLTPTPGAAEALEAACPAETPPGEQRPR